MQQMKEPSEKFPTLLQKNCTLFSIPIKIMGIYDSTANLNQNQSSMSFEITLHSLGDWNITYMTSSYTWRQSGSRKAKIWVQRINIFYTFNFFYQ